MTADQKLRLQMQRQWWERRRRIEEERRIYFQGVFESNARIRAIERENYYREKQLLRLTS